MWLKKLLEKRSSHGHGEWLRELNGAPDDYKILLRMDEQLFQQLVALVSPFIKNKILRFLATGNSFEDLKFSSRIAATTISEIVEELNTFASFHYQFPPRKGGKHNLSKQRLRRLQNY